jgi:quercetin dioxygenase-like cupin family protein
MSTLADIPRAIHRGEEELPFVALGDGTHLQLLLADIDEGLWVIRTRFEPGVIVPTHKHTGPVHAFTLSGSWKYEEYPEVNVAGSYLFEPAHSVHTLMVPDTNEGLTDAWFAIWGANLNLDADGNVETVIDAKTVADFYFLLCEAEGHPRPNVVIKSGVS